MFISRKDLCVYAFIDHVPCVSHCITLHRRVTKRFGPVLRIAHKTKRGGQTQSNYVSWKQEEFSGVFSSAIYIEWTIYINVLITVCPMYLTHNERRFKDEQPDKRIMTEEEGKALAAQWEAEYIETSARTGHNIDELFQTFIRCVITKSHSLQQK